MPSSVIVVEPEKSKVAGEEVNLVVLYFRILILDLFAFLASNIFACPIVRESSVVFLVHTHDSLGLELRWQVST